MRRLHSRRMAATAALALIAGAGVLTSACGGSETKVAKPAINPANGTSGAAAVDTAAAGEAFRDSQPGPEAPRPFQLPPIQTFDLDNGIHVYLVESHELPTVSVSLVLDGGSIVDPKGKEGEASVCMDMLTEGTRKLDKLAFARSLADLGSDVWSFAGLQTQGIAMRSLSKNFDETLKLFSDSLRNPAFRKADFDRLIDRRVQALRQQKGTAAGVAGRLFYSITSGADHPQGRLTTEKSLGRLRPAACKRYQRSYLKPEGARLFVVGDLTREQVQKAFASLASSWKGKAKLPKMPARKPRAGRIFFVDIPHAPQSSIFLTHAGPQRTDDNYFQNWMMAQIFGGSFSSRVNMNLREDKGYSYGVYGGFTYTREFGTFYTNAGVQADSTIQSIRELIREMKELHDGKRPAQEDELAREKNGAILALPARFATSRDALDQYRNLVYFGLPLDYYNSFVGNVSKVSLEQVNAAARSQLHPESVQILVVGDAHAPMKVRNEQGKDVPMVDDHGKPVTLLAALEKMAADNEVGEGGLVILDADGNVVKPKK